MLGHDKFELVSQLSVIPCYCRNSSYRHDGLLGLDFLRGFELNINFQDGTNPTQMNDLLTAPTPAATSCGCSTDGLKRPPAWNGMTLASVLPGIDSAEAAPEPDAPQGEYNPGAIGTLR